METELELKRYTFGVWLDIEALDYEDALWIFERVLETDGVVDSYNFEIKEIER